MQMIKKYSPVEQELIWISEYVDGTFLTEYDFITKKENSFYSIDKNKLIRFGIVGCGHKFFYEVFGGTFNIDGHMFEFVYEEGGKEYYLTGQNQFYRDLIQYKDAETMFDPTGSSSERSDVITQFNFGYKTSVDFEDVSFNFKAISCIPMFKGVPYFSLKLVSNRDMNGKIKVRHNCILIDEFDAPLKANIGGEINWAVK